MTAPTFPEVIARLLEARLITLHGAFPARVESYDRVRQMCSAKPLIGRNITVEDGSKVYNGEPVISNVPVMFPGSGDTSDAWDLERGDTVLLVISSRSLDKFLVRGGETEPDDERHHNINDAIAIPGLRDFAHPIPATGVSPDARVIRADELRLGSSLAVDYTIKGTTYRDAEDSYFSALEAALAAITVYVAAVGVADPSTAAAAGVFAASMADVPAALEAFHTAASTYLATKVKVE